MYSDDLRDAPADEVPGFYQSKFGCAAALRVHGPDVDVSQDSYDLPAFVRVPLSRATGLWRFLKWCPSVARDAWC